MSESGAMSESSAAGASGDSEVRILFAVEPPAPRC